MRPGTYTYVKPTSRTLATKPEEPGANGINAALKYASQMLRGEAARVDATLWNDVQKVMAGGCVYLESFLCGGSDFDLFKGLAKDLEAHGGGMVDWSKHLKHEDPCFSPTFRGVIARMGDYFDVEVHASRLNFYRDGTDWKPFHHDSHAYTASGREDFTMGASFGAERELAFLHEQSGNSFAFPQRNGDIFAFDSAVNQAFMHGIPRAKTGSAGCAPDPRPCPPPPRRPRFSIIAWGRRRSLNDRNGGAGGGGSGGIEGTRNLRPRGSDLLPPPEEKKPEDDKEVVYDGQGVAAIVEAWLAEREGAAEKGLAGGRARGQGAGKEAQGAGRPRGARAFYPSTPAVQRLRPMIGDAAYGELKSMARRHQRGELEAVDFCRGALEIAPADLLAELAQCMPGDQRRRDEVAAWLTALG